MFRGFREVREVEEIRRRDARISQATANNSTRPMYSDSERPVDSMFEQPMRQGDIRNGFNTSMESERPVSMFEQPMRY